MLRVLSKKQLEYGKRNFSYEKLGMEVSDEFHNRDDDKSTLGNKYRHIKAVYISTTESGGRSDNFRKFLTNKSDRMEDLKLYACLIYLTDPKNEYSSLTRHNFELEAPNQDLLVLLSKFLNPDAEEGVFNTKELFFPIYSSTQENAHYRLTMNRASEYYQYNSNLYIEICRDSTKRHFTGWTIISKNDVITMYLKDTATHEPLLLNVIAVNQSLYGKEPINCLTLVPVSEPLVLEAQTDIRSIFALHYEQAGKEVLSLCGEKSISSEDI